jgi:hypothetical protein
MSRLAFILSALLATQAVASPPESRTWLSGLGVGLIGVGVGLATFGVGQQFIAADSMALVRSYGVPTTPEAASVGLLDVRARNASTSSLVAFLCGGVLLAGGIVALLLDTRAPTVSIIALPGGGAVSASLRF